MSFTFVPKNDAQLNELISNLNNAYGSYFDFKISEKRSNKLRDCICEGLGFTNGAYQQLQKYWESNMCYKWSDKDFIVGLKSSLEEGRYIAVFAPSFLAPSLVEKFNIQYPAGDKGLLNEDDAEGVTESWKIDSLDETDEKNMIEFKEYKGFYPVFFAGILVGHAFEKKYAALLNAMLVSLSFDSDSDIVNNRQDKMSTADEHFDFYLNQTDGVKTPYGKYLSLRMESMPHSVLVPFDSVEIEFSKITVHYGTTKTVLNYDFKSGQIIWNDIPFDFASFFNMNRVDQEKSITMIKEDVEQKVQNFEWFPEQSIEFLADGEDDFSGEYFNPSTIYTIK